jgi:hypothetical protein
MTLLLLIKITAGMLTAMAKYSILLMAVQLGKSNWNKKALFLEP